MNYHEILTNSLTRWLSELNASFHLCLIRHDICHFPRIQKQKANERTRGKPNTDFEFTNKNVATISENKAFIHSTLLHIQNVLNYFFFFVFCKCVY